MGSCTQGEINDVVLRCRTAAKTHGGQSDKMEEVRKYYAMFHSCPEHGALVMLNAALDMLEKGI